MDKPVRILFVEDSEDDLLILLRELKKGGYKPTYKRVDTESGFQAALSEETWDIVISDYKMPRFSAPLALQYLKKTDLDIPFIVVSGAIQEEVAVDVMRAGAQDYLMKDKLTRLVPAIERELIESANRREHKRAENLLLRLGRIIDNASNEIYVLDAATLRLIQVNQKAQQNLEYPETKLDQLTWLDLQPENDPNLYAEWTKALYDGEQELITYETILSRLDGSIYPVEVNLHLSRIETPPVLVAIVQDITRRKMSEHAIQTAYEKEAAARQEAERANAMKNQFLGMITHELRTPLTTIKGFTTTLMSTDVTWSIEDHLEFLSIIDEEADKLRELIEQLLDVSQLQAGVLSISPEPHTLNAIFEKAKMQLSTVSNGHPLKIDSPETLPPVNADLHRISQVLVNLVGNAAKFSELGKLITITVTTDEDFILISVHDEGIGIPVKDREKIFEPYRQLERDGYQKKLGAGLGLAICKGIIEAHGGRIWVEDQHTPGTTISFTLPFMSANETFLQ